MAAWRRGHLAGQVRSDWREQFDRQGYVEVLNVLSDPEFQLLRQEVFAATLPARSHQQGDTITTRLPVGRGLLDQSPALDRLLQSKDIKSLLAYVASTTSPPLYYLQAIHGGVVNGPKDPQIELHADTFHPSMKAWLFMTDVCEAGRPLTYVPGSHQLSRGRLAWEKQKSLEVMNSDDRLSQRGSLRVSDDELAELGLPPPIHFVVPANTLVVIDTCGFHARADSEVQSRRVEIWAYSRRSPYLPWAGLDPLSWRPFAERRAGWFLKAVDFLDRRGWAKQHWQPSANWNEIAKKD